MHICSEVEGKLKDGLDAFDAIESLLPAGTLSGARKSEPVKSLKSLKELPEVYTAERSDMLISTATSIPVSLSEWRSRKMTRFMFRRVQAL